MLAERAIRTTMDDIRTLLRDSDLGHSYWAEAAAYSVETRNLIPSCCHPGKVPLESFTGKRQSSLTSESSALNVGRRSPQLMVPRLRGGRSWMREVSSADSWAMPLAMGTIRSRMSYLAVCLLHVTLSSRRAHLTAPHRPWGSETRYLTS